MAAPAVKKKGRRKKKVPARTLLRRLHKKADKAVSEYVRAMTAAEYAGKCPFCRERPIEVCFHFVRRGRKILRWDLRNVIGSCSADNYHEYRNPDPYRAWYIRRFGVEQYLSLVDESAAAFEPTAEYLSGLVERFTAALETLKAPGSAATDIIPPVTPAPADPTYGTKPETA